VKAKGVALLAAGFLLLASCGNGDDPEAAPDTDDGVSQAFPRQEVAVAVGEEPPSPEDVGVGDEVNPIDRDTLDIDVATFGEQWNATAGDLGEEGLIVDEWLVGYAMPGGSFTHEFADWLAVFGGWSYQSGDLTFASVEWDFVPEIDGELTFSSWPTLIGAVLGADSPETIIEVMDDLGLIGVTEDDFAVGLDAEVERDGVVFEVFSIDSGGILEARPAG